jgi:hypothetical protein
VLLGCFCKKKESFELTLRQKLRAGWEVLTSFYIAFLRIKIPHRTGVLIVIRQGLKIKM